MITVSDLSLSFGERFLFKDVNIQFNPGNCYGLIGANGSGKSTFLKILSGEIEQTTGMVTIGKNLRMAVLKQDHFAFDEFPVIDTVIMGHTYLHNILKEREALYAKEEFTDADGERSCELESLMAELNGYDAEADAASLLSRLGINDDLQKLQLKELEGGQKMRVLLAQALYGNPDILLMDEPTNHLDLTTIDWLEDFLLNFQNLVIVVSHDRHFLNSVCTHIADIDFKRMQVFTGNYDFWYHASQLAMKQKKDVNKKNEEKIKELQSFIYRFSANASKSRQATSRKKLIDKLTPQEMPATSRQIPYIAFKPERECGNVILEVENLNKTIDGITLIKDFNLIVNRNDKIAFVGAEHFAKTAFFEIISGSMKPDTGQYKWGQTIINSYFPKESGDYFDSDVSIIDWLKNYSTDKTDSYVRGFLGCMLFSGDEVFKSIKVLSGGEKVRCLLSRMMLIKGNAMVLDEPTNHLDLESISALNDGLINFKGVLLFNSHDHEFVQTIANRIIEFTPGGVIDRMMTFDEYMQDPNIKTLRDQYYFGHVELSI